MDKLVFDSGIKEFQIEGGGVLRFNPADPNVYARFLEAADRLLTLEKELTAQADAPESELDGLRLITRADREAKKILAWIFGAANDFDAILGGVNLLAVASNGERVVTNFLTALEPILLAGAEACARQQTEAAVAKAVARRAAQ